VFGLSLVQVILLLFFGAMIIYVTENVEGRGHEPRQGVEEAKTQEASLHARLDATAEKNTELERQLGDMTVFVDELKLMVGAKVASKEGFQEAIENLKRGYSCQKDNMYAEASIQNGAETVQVIGDIPGDPDRWFGEGDQTTDLDQIVSFIQDDLVRIRKRPQVSIQLSTSVCHRQRLQESERCTRSTSIPKKSSEPDDSESSTMPWSELRRQTTRRPGAFSAQGYHELRGRAVPDSPAE
jgi:hypothetical protein